jgi:beta-glucosidase-like glycosyl hydrolase
VLITAWRAGVAATIGLQGRNCGGATLGPSKISAQAKHFAVYGAGGRDGYTPMGGGPSERTVFEVYLRPWLKFAQAGGRGVMLSHNMALWEPMHASFRLVTETLRNRFGLLGGYTGSDMGKHALSHKFQIQSNVDGSNLSALGLPAAARCPQRYCLLWCWA